MSGSGHGAAFRRWARRFIENVLPRIRESGQFVLIAPNPGVEDVQMAAELGFAIWLDKPLIVLVPKGRHISARLSRAADCVVDVDLATEAGREAAEREIQAAVKARDGEMQ